MTIKLPLPERALSPNARTHPLARQKVTRAARQRAIFATLAALGVPPDVTEGVLGALSIRSIPELEALLPS